MVYVVRWFPVGPEVSVTCHSLDEVLRLADELSATKATLGVRVTLGDQEIKLPLAQNANEAPGPVLN